MSKPDSFHEFELEILFGDSLPLVVKGNYSDRSDSVCVHEIFAYDKGGSLKPCLHAFDDAFRFLGWAGQRPSYEAIMDEIEVAAHKAYHDFLKSYEPDDGSYD